jgi:glutathione S-transferase
MVKLHRCKVHWLKTGGHACWRVESALRDMGIEYEIVDESYLKGRRPDVVRMTGQRMVPVIEFEDGSAYREESADMAARIRAGRLFEESDAPAS